MTWAIGGFIVPSFFPRLLDAPHALPQEGWLRVFAPTFPTPPPPPRSATPPPGARLTAFELAHDKLPATLICDSAVAALMSSGQVDAVVVGADR